MNKKLHPMYLILNNKYLRKFVFLLPLVINFILTTLIILISNGMIEMEFTNFMAGLFIFCVVWFIMWVLIIIHAKNKIARYTLKQQINY